jgi:hypothetical protein
MLVLAKKPGMQWPAQDQMIEGATLSFHRVTWERISGAEVGDRRSKERWRKRWVGFLADLCDSDSVYVWVRGAMIQ